MDGSDIVQLIFIAVITWYLIFDFLVPLKTKLRLSGLYHLQCLPPVEQMLMTVCKMNKCIDLLDRRKKNFVVVVKFAGA